MAFDTFSGLKAAIGNWLDQAGESDFEGVIDDIVTLGENRLAQDMRLRYNEIGLSASMSGGESAVPSDYLGLKHGRLILNNLHYPLELRDSHWIYKKYPLRSATSTPEFIGVDGASFVYGPYPDTDSYSLTGTYWFRPTALSDSNTSNEWTSNTPDLLFFACLAESADFISASEQTVKWEAKYQAIKKRYENAYNQQFRSGRRMSAA